MLFNITGLEFQRKKMKNQWHLHHNTVLEQQDSGKVSSDSSWELPLFFFLPSTSYRCRSKTIYFILPPLNSMDSSYELFEHRHLWHSCLYSDLVLADIQTILGCFHPGRSFERAWKVSWHNREYFEKFTWERFKVLLDIGQGHGHIIL